ncbi:MAG: hypothetical protein WBG48_03225 [Pricia sp.]
MKIPLFFLMLILANCPGTKKTATAEASGQAGQDKVEQTAGADESFEEHNSAVKAQDVAEQSQDSVEQSQDSVEQSQNNVEQLHPIPVKTQGRPQKMQDSVPVLSFVAGDAYGGMETEETLIITSAKTLAKFYSRVNRTRKPGLPIPDVDFSKEMVVVYSTGAITGDALPELYVAKVEEDVILLGVKDKIGDASSSAITTPFVVYKMPITDKEVLVR